jgi:hypothetical protein
MVVARHDGLEYEDGEIPFDLVGTNKITLTYRPQA